MDRRTTVAQRPTNAVQNKAPKVRRRSRPILDHDEELAQFMKKKALERQRQKHEQQRQQEEAVLKKQRALEHLKQFTNGQLKMMKEKGQPAVAKKPLASVSNLPPRVKSEKKPIVQAVAEVHSRAGVLHSSMPREVENRVAKPKETVPKTVPVRANPVAPTTKARALTMRQRAKTPLGVKPQPKALTVETQKAKVIASAKPRAFSIAVKKLEIPTARGRTTQRLHPAPPVLRPRDTIIARAATTIAKPRPTKNPFASTTSVRRSSMPAEHGRSRDLVSVAKPTQGTKTILPTSNPAKTRPTQPPAKLVLKNVTRPSTQTVARQETIQGKQAQASKPNTKKQPETKKRGDALKIKKITETKTPPKKKEFPKPTIVSEQDQAAALREVKESVEESIPTKEAIEQARVLAAVLTIQKRYRRKKQQAQRAGPADWKSFVSGIARFQALYRGHALRRKRVEATIKSIVNSMVEQAYFIWRHKQRIAQSASVGPLVASSPVTIKEGYLDARIGYIRLSVGALCGAFIRLYGPYGQEAVESEESQREKRMALDHSFWVEFAEGEPCRKMLASSQPADEMTANFCLRKIKLSDRLLFDLVNQALTELASQGYQRLAEKGTVTLMQLVMAKLQGWLGDFEFPIVLNKLVEQEAIELTKMQQNE